ILSSIASQCDHVEHVNTQLPYAMVVGFISIAGMASILVAGIPWWVIYPAGIALMAGIIYKFGKIHDPEDYATEGKEAAATSLDYTGLCKNALLLNFGIFANSNPHLLFFKDRSSIGVNPFKRKCKTVFLFYLLRVCFEAPLCKGYPVLPVD